MTRKADLMVIGITIVLLFLFLVSFHKVKVLEQAREQYEEKNPSVVCEEPNTTLIHDCDDIEVDIKILRYG